MVYNIHPYVYMYTHTHTLLGYPGCAVVENTPANAGDAEDTGSILGLGRSPGVRNFPLENSTDRGAWWTTVHGVSMSQTQLSTHTYTHIYVVIYVNMCIYIYMYMKMAKI